MIRYSCPSCKALLGSPPTKAGKKVLCPNCQQKLRVPAPQNKTMLGILEPNSSVQSQSPNRAQHNDILPDVAPPKLTTMPHRGATIFTLGIAGLLFAVSGIVISYFLILATVGLILGLVANSMAKRDLRRMDDGSMDGSGRQFTTAGRTCARISFLTFAVATIVFAVVLVNAYRIISQLPVAEELSAPSKSSKIESPAILFAKFPTSDFPKDSNDAVRAKRLMQWLDANLTGQKIAVQTKAKVQTYQVNDIWIASVNCQPIDMSSLLGKPLSLMLYQRRDLHPSKMSDEEFSSYIALHHRVATFTFNRINERQAERLADASRDKDDFLLSGTIHRTGLSIHHFFDSWRPIMGVSLADVKFKHLGSDIEIGEN